MISSLTFSLARGLISNPFDKILITFKILKIIIQIHLYVVKTEEINLNHGIWSCNFSEKIALIMK